MSARLLRDARAGWNPAIRRAGTPALHSDILSARCGRSSVRAKTRGMEMRPAPGLRQPLPQEKGKEPRVPPLEGYGSRSRPFPRFDRTGDDTEEGMRIGIAAEAFEARRIARGELAAQARRFE